MSKLAALSLIFFITCGLIFIVGRIVWSVIVGSFLYFRYLIDMYALFLEERAVDDSHARQLSLMLHHKLVCKSTRESCILRLKNLEDELKRTTTNLWRRTSLKKSIKEANEMMDNARKQTVMNEEATNRLQLAYEKAKARFKEPKKAFR
jgi:hypothetical protein